MTSGADAPASASSAPVATPARRRAWLLAPLFALFGVAVVAWLIARSNPALLWSTVVRGAAWLPLLFVLELTRVAIEAWGGRALYRPRIPYLLLLRACLVAYAIGAFAPAGRASGEAVKAGMLRDHTDLSDTAAAATTIQTCSLLALGVWSAICAVVAFRFSTPLTSALAIQAALVFVAAAFIRGVVSTRLLGRITGFLGRTAPKALTAVDAVRLRARDQRLAAPFSAFLASRGLQLVQCAIIFLAITGRLDVTRGVLAFGVSTVSGTLGDSVPAQVGVLDGSFTATARLLQLTREDALAFALLGHALQIAAVAVGVLTPVVWRARSPRG